MLIGTSLSTDPRRQSGIALLMVLALGMLVLLDPAGVAARQYANLAGLSMTREMIAQGAARHFSSVQADHGLPMTPGLVTADQMLAAALRLNPKDSRALAMRGTLHLVLADHITASNLLSRAALEAPDDPVLALCQGLSRYLLGRPDDALRAWQRGYNMDVALWWMGRELYLAGDREQAFALWRMAEEVDATPRRLKRQMYRRMCTANSKQENWGEALYWCAQAFAADPIPKEEVALASAHSGAGNLAEAKSIASRVLSDANAQPADLGAAHWVLGRIFVQQGRLDDALSQYWLALDFRPEDKHLLLDLARLYLQMDRYDEADRTLQFVQRLDSGSGAVATEAREIEEEMRLLQQSLKETD